MRRPRRGARDRRHERAVSPPGAEDRVDLQAERPGPAQPGRAPEALERDAAARRRRTESRRRAPTPSGRQRGARGRVRRSRAREPVERVRRAVAGLGAPRANRSKNAGAARTDDRPPRARPAAARRASASRPARTRRRTPAARERQTTCQPARAERALERREEPPRRPSPSSCRRACYFSWNGYGVVKPSEGGKRGGLDRLLDAGARRRARELAGDRPPR